MPSLSTLTVYAHFCARCYCHPLKSYTLLTFHDVNLMDMKIADGFKKKQRKQNNNKKMSKGITVHSNCQPVLSAICRLSVFINGPFFAFIFMSFEKLSYCNIVLDRA